MLKSAEKLEKVGGNGEKGGEKLEKVGKSGKTW